MTELIINRWVWILQLMCCFSRCLSSQTSVASPEVCYHLYCFTGVQLQVILAAPESQAVNFFSVGCLVPIGNESNEGCVIRKYTEFDRGVAGGAVVGVEGEE